MLSPSLQAQSNAAVVELQALSDPSDPKNAGANSRAELKTWVASAPSAVPQAKEDPKPAKPSCFSSKKPFAAFAHSAFDVQSSKA